MQSDASGCRRRPPTRTRHSSGEADSLVPRFGRHSHRRCGAPGPDDGTTDMPIRAWTTTYRITHASGLRLATISHARSAAIVPLPRHPSWARGGAVLPVPGGDGLAPRSGRPVPVRAIEGGAGRPRTGPRASGPGRSVTIRQAAIESHARSRYEKQNREERTSSCRDPRLSEFTFRRRGPVLVPKNERT